MGRKKRNRLPPFVALTWEVLNSQAYKDLAPSAAKALPYFLGKVKLSFSDPEKYKMTFPFSYSEAEGYGFSTATFSRLCKELVRKGFIEYGEKGGLRGNSKASNKYRLSSSWVSYNKEKTTKPAPVKLSQKKPFSADDKPETKRPIVIRK